MRIVSSVIGMSSVISRLPVGPNARGPPKGQPSTPYAQPVEVGAFSRDRAGGVHYDRRTLRKYHEPRLPSPLSAGFNDFVPKRNDLAASEAALVAAAEKFPDAKRAAFVTYRNNLNKLCATPYSDDDWEMGVSRLADGRALLSVRETERRRRNDAAQTDDERLWSFFGYRFEALCTDDDATRPVDANEEFFGVFACKLGDHRLCVAAEIDCEDGSGYVELKTNKLLNTPRQVRTFERFKLFKFWLQSFLVGTPAVVVGFRDDAGECSKRQRFDTLKLPALGAKHWQPRVALHFADSVLSWLSDATWAAWADEPDAELVVRFEPSERSVVLLRKDRAKKARTD